MGTLSDAENNVGYMSWARFERFRDAVNSASSLVGWLRVAGHVRSGDPDELRIRQSGPAIPLPATWLAAEEISRLLGELNRWPELSDAANDMQGQFLAEQLIREVETAQHRWPTEDKTHKVKWVMCSQCQGQGIRYLPPRHAGDQVVIRCSDCGAVEDSETFGLRVVLVERELRESRRLDHGKRSA